MTRSIFTNRTCVLCIIAKKTIKSFMEAGAFMYQLNSNEFSSFYLILILAVFSDEVSFYSLV